MQARLTWIVMFALTLAVAGAGTDAQKNRTTGGASDAVFGDLGGENPDRIRSDEFMTQECSSVSDEASRYCGDSAADLIDDGIGPECSRVSYGSNGQYLFRTLTSNCPSFPPLGEGRKLTLDFTQHLTGACRNSDPADDVVWVTVDDKPRDLHVCGSNLVEDVQIIADGMFTGSSSVVTIYFSLHSPPLSNVMQFVMEFTRPLPVANTLSARVLSATNVETAMLWRRTTGKGGKVQMSLIGEYQMPFSLTARKAPMPTSF